MELKKLIELKQERANLTNSIRALMTEFEGKEMGQEKKDELSKMESRFDAINDNIILEEKQAAREKIITDPTPTPAPKDETRQLFAKALSGDSNHIREFQNAMSLGTDATAGYLTAPVDFRNELIRGLDDMMFMRQLSTVVGPIGAAQSLGFPYRNTSAGDATWVAEVTSAGEETTLDFGRREFKPNKLARLIKLSKALMNHAPTAEATIMREIMYKISIAQENAYLNGSGSAQPLGVFTASTSGVTTARDVSTDNTATTVTFDGLQNAKYSLKQQYWANANWIAHRDFCKMVAKIKDGEGQYIWQGAVVNGQPDRLLGFPVNMSEYAPNTFTTGLYVGILGDFKNGYMIADADAISIQVLKELYAVTGQIGYLVDYFGDGAPVLAEAFARVKLG